MVKLHPGGHVRASSHARDASARTIVLLERDPYLAFLLRLYVPEGTVVEMEPDAKADDVLSLAPQLVVTGVEGDVLGALLVASDRPKILAVVDSARAARSALPSAIDGILVRPFAPSEFAKAVRGALGLGPPEEDERTIGPTLARARAYLAPARVAGVAVAAVLEVARTEVSPARGWILGVAFVYTTLRWLLGNRPSIVADAADVAVALALVAATGALSSNYTPFAVIVTIASGLIRGPSFGALGGLVIVAGSLPLEYRDISSGAVGLRESVAWALLFPMIGVTAGFASRVWRQPTADGLNVLIEANRMLSSLYRIARTLPGGLEIGSVAEATMHEIRDAIGARGGAMLVADAGSYAVVGSFGLTDPGSVLVREGWPLDEAILGRASVLKRDDLHPATAQALGDHPCWLAAAMRRDGIPQGVLLAACPDEEKHDANIAMLRRLAEEATVAVENARLFSRVREISIDEERRRLARELHDGIAQSLTHLRYELDFLSRHGGPGAEPVRRDIQRLSRVVERTSADVRSMILGLRASVAEQGLVGALRSYLADLQRLGGPNIVFDARGEVRLPGDIEGEIFRVAQEAVSNALRHSSARTINVRLASGATQVTMIVDDDGTGLKGKRAKAGGGVGLEAMKERAELIGAHLMVAERPEGGTRVLLEYQTGENR